LAALVGASLFAMQASKNLSDAWLSKWTLNSTNNDTSDFGATFLYGSRQVMELVDEADRSNTRYYLTVFICLAGANTIFTLFRAFLFAYGGVVAARNLHSSLLTRVLTSSISFWDSTPVSRFIVYLKNTVQM
jgi:ATP-binding cassette subfamily C (CFTR/MRP) protein 10